MSYRVVRANQGRRLTGSRAEVTSPRPAAMRDLSLNENFVRLFAKHQRQLYGYIVTLLPNRTDADDVLQQTSMILWRKFEQFRPEADFAAWACGIARYEVRNFLRRKRRDRHYFSDELLDSLAQERLARANRLEPRRQALITCLSKLSHRERELVERCYGGETTTKEVAQQMQRPVDTVYKMLNRIRRRLFECIDRTLAAETHA